MLEARNAGGLCALGGQRAHIACERQLQKVRSMRAADNNGCKWRSRGRTVAVIEMRVAMHAGLVVDPHALRQVAQCVLALVENFEVHARAMQRLAAAGCIRKRHTGAQHGSHVARQLVHLLFYKAALRDPRRCQAQTRRVKRTAIAGDGIAVYNHTRQIQNARCHLAH